VETEVALFLPGEDLGVELLQALDRRDAEERLQVPDNSFDAAFIQSRQLHVIRTMRDTFGSSIHLTRFAAGLSVLSSQNSFGERRE